MSREVAVHRLIAPSNKSQDGGGIRRPFVLADWKTSVRRMIGMVPTTVVVVLIATKVSLVFFARPDLWIDTLFDDAYYYLGVARHISLGDGSMFAPPLQTNGYQPLWLLVLSAASFLVGADRQLLVASAHLISAAAIMAFFAIAWRQERKVWPAALAVLAFPSVYHAGMETVLIPPLALLYFRTNGLKRGVFASLIFLSRLDAIGLILGREAYQFLRTRTVDVKAGAILTVTVAVYGCSNYLLFGTPVPVSGIAKAIGNVRGENWLVGFNALISALPVLALLALGCLGARSIAKLRNAMPIFASLAALGCSVAYYCVFSGWIVWEWYMWPLALLLYFSLLEKPDATSSQVRVGRILVVMAITGIGLIGILPAFNAPVAMDLSKWILREWYVWPVVLLLLYLYLLEKLEIPITPVSVGRIVLVFAAISVGLIGIVPAFTAPVAAAIGLKALGTTWGQANVTMAGRISSSPLIGATFAMGDRAGSLGYLLPDRFRFVQTEGLVANLAYVRSLRDGSAIDFLARMPVNYLIVDRGQYWMLGGVFAVPEPIQGLSARHGVVLLCFRRSADSQDFDSPRPERKIFLFAERVPCPSGTVAVFKQRQQTYGEIRSTSLWVKRPTGFFGAIQ